MKTNALLLAALALAACSPDFDPASKVDKLRVLAIRADHPELEPGVTDVTPLGALVVRADFASDRARTTTVVYLACVPEPGDARPTACAALASLRDPTAAFVSAAGASCGAAAPPEGEVSPAAFAGVAACDAVGSGCAPVDLGGVPAPALALRTGYRDDFQALCSSPDPASRPAECILGVQAAVLAFAIDATPAEIAEGATGACPLGAVAARFSSLWSSRDHVLSLKRVQIRGPQAVDPPNENPVITGITGAAGAALPGTLPARDTELAPDPADVSSLAETYTKLDAAGTPIETAREEWVYSWFGTAGEMQDLHTRPPALETWKLTAADAAASGGSALVAAVVRDLRGGVAWTVREVALQP